MDVVPAAGAVITDGDGRVLLVRRGAPPQRDRWSVPGGRLEPGETFADAAAREVLEETGLRVAVGRELWTLRLPTGDGREFDVHDFAATVVGGALAAGDDAADARWFAPAELHRLRVTTHLIEHLRRAGVVDSLPHVDEHVNEVAAGRDVVWRALAEVVSHAASARFARMLGADDVTREGPAVPGVGAVVPGFHVVAAEPPQRLSLAGRHRFSDYELTFRIDALGPDRSLLRAETRAIFPGRSGTVYRGVLMGLGLHRAATRRMLRSVRRRAEASARTT
ncbi:NUDIX hydrolase [Agromyces bracchium]|uniref:NUDIX domain-containing protein n=1 Tax=Agromyces bracchium TaxID=88376 RepID=A0A6I3M2X4_9MICO|nr:NUDIX domain-containing protein [Agromyces bracchium]MTH67684.1 NUDIX domain-containing protein [Agromyces bracchium]